MYRLRSWGVFTVLLAVALTASAPARAQVIETLIVEIKTGNKRFAGTDDPVHLLLGGKDFNLDNPNHDDFERNHTDVFTLPVNDPDYSVDLIRAIGRITISKTGDSTFGGGWLFGTITVRINDPASEPIYQNLAINKWLDGDHREWHSDLGEDGWNLPEPPPFPPCSADVPVILLKATQPSAFADTDQPGIDSDCDGIPDDVDDTFDPNPPDDDGDGLPNLYETQNGMDPNSPDSDSDGWLDNRNVRDLLLLTKVECVDEAGSVEIGSDEIYVNVEDVRFPLSPSLDNYWELDDGTKVEPFIIVDSRTVPSTNTTPQYQTRVWLRESDLAIMEKPFDDTFATLTVEWTRSDTKNFDLPHADRHYRLSFRSVTTSFLDPTGGSGQGDNDGDMIADSLEFLISAQSFQLLDATPVPGYDGLATPLRRNIFIEVDATDSDANIPFDARQQVASQFFYHNISMHLDNGYLKGGEILPFDETVHPSERDSLRHVHQRSERFSFFKYCMFVPNLGSFSKNGIADRPGKTLLVSRSTMIGSFSSVVFMHELGHTLSLCHPIGTSEPPSPSPACPTPDDWHGTCDDCCFRFIVVNNDTTFLPMRCCEHYCGVDGGDITAMGSDVGVPELVIGGAIGILVGLAIIALFIPGIGWLAGAALLAAAALLGAFGGFFFSDAYLRVVDYHVNEWAVVLLNSF